ncbi:MAG: DHA2 family efflux MFS transporter permease subunit [Acidithiobacillus sp.]
MQLIFKKIRLVAEDMPPGQFLLLNAVMGFAHIFVLINMGAYLAMLPEVGSALGVNPEFAAWPLTQFFVGLALAAPISAWLTAKQGAARVFFLEMIGFALTAVICGFTHNFIVFLVSRFFMGVFSGLIIPLSLQVLLRYYRPNYHKKALGLWGAAALTPFTIAPLLGGWMTDAWGWRSLFWIDAVLALLLGTLGALLLLGREKEAKISRPDWPGLAFLTVALVTTQLIFDLGEKDDWLRSNTILFLLVLAIVTWLLLLVWEWHTPNPLVDYRLFRERNFTIAIMGIFVGTLFFQGLMALYVVQSQVIFGFTAFLAGLTVLPMALFAKPVSILMHRAVQRFDPRLLAFANFLGFALGCWIVASYDRNASYSALLWPQFLVGIFLGGLFAPLTVMALTGLSGSAENKAVGVFNMFRVAAQGYGIPILAAWAARRAALNRHFLIEPALQTPQNLVAHNQILLQRGLSSTAIRAINTRLIDHHAALLAFNEMFYAAAWVFAGLAVLMLLARPVRHPLRNPTDQQRLEELAEP